MRRGEVGRSKIGKSVLAVGVFGPMEATQNLTPRRNEFGLDRKICGRDMWTKEIASIRVYNLGSVGKTFTRPNSLLVKDP